MPIFEYVCTSCGYRFEKLEKTAAAANIDCPACGALDVQKQFSSFASGAKSEGCTPSVGGG